MTFLFADLADFALATLVAILLLILPGFGLLRLLERVGIIDSDEVFGCWGLVLGMAILPAIDALLVRFGGIPSALLLHMILAGLGYGAAMGAAKRLPASGWIVAALWWVIVSYGLADFGDAGGANQPLTVLDTVKHAAVVASISAHGLPLVDPFFARDTPAGYYHYFYIGPALIDWLIGAADARPAFMAGAWYAGFALFSMLLLVARRAGLVETVTPRFAIIVASLLCISGLDLLPALAIWLRYDIVLGQLDWWADEVRWGVGSLWWVPHHVSALVAGLGACLLLVEAGSKHKVLTTLVVGIMLASSFGMSIWVAIALAAALAFWWVTRLLELPRASMALPFAAIPAVLIALPQFIDLFQGRVAAGIPLMLRPRPFGNGWETGLFQDLALMPLSLVLEFGLFAYGSWRWHRAVPMGQSRVGLLLPVLAVTGLICACFIRSTVINNDFAWRAMLLAQLPAMLWTGAWLARGGLRKGEKTAALFLGALGLLTMLADATGLRAVREPDMRTTLAFTNRHPEMDAELRLAYHWANSQLPLNAVIQHNPAIDERSIDFGLYGRHRTGVADGVAQLFGADPAEVTRRVATIRPAFETAEPLTVTRARLAAIGADTILLTSRDPLWRKLGGPPVDWSCAYRSEAVCIATWQGKPSR